MRCAGLTGGAFRSEQQGKTVPRRAQNRPVQQGFLGTFEVCAQFENEPPGRSVDSEGNRTRLLLLASRGWAGWNAPTRPRGQEATACWKDVCWNLVIACLDGWEGLGHSVPGSTSSHGGAPPVRRRSAARASGASTLPCARRRAPPLLLPEPGGWPIQLGQKVGWLTFGRRNGWIDCPAASPSICLAAWLTTRRLHLAEVECINLHNHHRYAGLPATSGHG